MLTLHSPMCISARLLPAVHVGDAWISIEPRGVRDNRIEWAWYVDRPGHPFGGGEGADLSTGPQHTDDEAGYREAMSALLSFLMHAAEQYRHDVDYEDESFSRALVEWAYQNDDELGMTQVELEEGGQ